MLAAEIACAVGALTAFARLGDGTPREHRVAALVFYPVIGLAQGAIAAAVAAATGSGLVGVLVLMTLSGSRPWYGLAAACALVAYRTPAARLAALRGAPGRSGWAVAGAVFAAKLWAGAALPPSARLPALLVAPMLGTWAMVVQCYGGSPAEARGPARDLIGRARFREFGWASLLALGGTLAVGDAVGLLVVLVAALVAVGFRILAHRRLGGMTGRLLYASRELVETAVLVTLAGLARLLA